MLQINMNYVCSNWRVKRFTIDVQLKVELKIWREEGSDKGKSRNENRRKRREEEGG